jgi:hypothetical protein
MRIISNKNDLTKLYKLLGIFSHLMENISEQKFENDYIQLEEIYYEYKNNYEKHYTYELLEKVNSYIDKNFIEAK